MKQYARRSAFNFDDLQSFKMNQARLRMLFLGMTLMSSACTKSDRRTQSAASNENAPESNGGTKAQEASAPKASPKNSDSGTNARVFLEWPEDGSTLFANQKLRFGLSNLKLVPAGSELENPNAGHHHLLIDQGPMPKGQTIPMSPKHIHFGKAQVTGAAPMTPGEHQVTLQFANGAHVSYGAERAASYTFNVKEAPKKSGVRIENLENSKEPVPTLSSPLKLKFAVEGFTIRPAGEEIKDKTSGHHHIIIDGTYAELGETIPMDKTHIHYGKGQREAEIELSPGEHTITLQFADGAHRSYGEVMSRSYAVVVK